jgi:hypothetical protein
MALHHDLLEQADHLASRERLRPRQASLRRAVSAAYYALFHLLADEGARRLTPPQPSPLRRQVSRAFDHRHMREVCQEFKKPNLPDNLRALLDLPVETDLMAVANAFVALQNARHEADYDLSATFNRIEVLQKIAQVHSAFFSWQAVRGRPNATVFLAALLLRRHWRRGSV